MRYTTLPPPPNSFPWHNPFRRTRPDYIGTIRAPVPQPSGTILMLRTDPFPHRCHSYSSLQGYAARPRRRPRRPFCTNKQLFPRFVSLRNRSHSTSQGCAVPRHALVPRPSHTIPRPRHNPYVHAIHTDNSLPAGPVRRRRPVPRPRGIHSC